MEKNDNVVQLHPPMFLKYKPAVEYTGLPEKLLRRLVKENKVDHFFSGKTTYLSVTSLKQICANGAVF